MTDTPAGWYRSGRPAYRQLPEPDSELVELESAGCGAEWIIYGAAVVTVAVVVGILVGKALR